MMQQYVDFYSQIHLIYSKNYKVFEERTQVFSLLLS